MKRFCRVGFFCLLLGGMSNQAVGQGPLNRPFGLGLSLGDPAGITAKYWFDQQNALDFGLGYGYFPFYGGLAVYSDYLRNVFEFVPGQAPPFKLVLYLGVGGKFGYWRYHRNDNDLYGPGFGIRIPFGITMIFKKVPFDTFLEITPCLAFMEPRPFWFDFDAAVGGRVYF